MGCWCGGLAHNYMETEAWRLLVGDLANTCAETCIRDHWSLTIINNCPVLYMSHTFLCGAMN